MGGRRKAGQVPLAPPDERSVSRGEWDMSRESEPMNRVPEKGLKPFLAHVRRHDDGSWAIHELEEPVRAVGGQIPNPLDKR